MDVFFFSLQIKGDSPQRVSSCGNYITCSLSLNMRENPDIMYFGNCSKMYKNKLWEHYRRNIICSRDDRVSNAARQGRMFAFDIGGDITFLQGL